MEKINKPISGFVILLLCLVLLGIAAYLFVIHLHEIEQTENSVIGGIMHVRLFIFYQRTDNCKSKPGHGCWYSLENMSAR